MLSLIVAAVAAAAAVPAITMVPFSHHVAVVSSRPGCDVAAGVDGTPFWQMPTMAAELGASGVSQVKIDLDASGNLIGARLYAGSGNALLDDAALQSARLTRFTPETSNCERVAGSYLYDVEF